MQRLLAPILAIWVLCVGLAAGVARGAEEDDLRSLRRKFLVDRNTCGLATAFAGKAADRFSRADALLALLICEDELSPDDMRGVGYDALPAFVWAMKQLDLQAAGEALERVGHDVVGGIEVWAAALLDARRGADDAAVERVLEVARQPFGDVEHTLFALAMLGVSLPGHDQILLSGIGRRALLRACRTGELDVLPRLARSLAALQSPRLGPESLCLAARALRRSGRLTEAEALLEGPEVREQRPDVERYLRLERALWYWLAGQPSEARSLCERLSVMPDLAFAVRALREARDPLRLPAVPSGPLVVKEERREAVTLARLLQILGMDVRPEDVEAASIAKNRELTDLGFVREFLESQGCTVFVSAGSPEAGRMAVEHGLPFLLYRIRLRGDRFVDTPHLVRSRDRTTGLLAVDTFCLDELDVLPPDAPIKGWTLIALPPGADPAWTESLDGQGHLLGETITGALDTAHHGDVVGALKQMHEEAPTFGNVAAYDLYQAYLYHRHFKDFDSAKSLHHASQLLERSARTGPQLAFEHFVRALRLWRVRGGEMDETEALEGFHKAHLAAPTSSFIARVRYGVFAELKDNYEFAERMLEIAQVLDPLDVRTLYHQARWYRTRRGKKFYPEARGAIRRAVDRCPTARELVLELVALDLDSGQPQVALDALNGFIARAPEAASDERVRALRRKAEGPLIRAAASVDSLNQFLASPSQDTRRLVAYQLAKLETGEAESALRGLLNDEAHAVRVTALRVYMRPRLSAYVETDKALADKVVAMIHEDDSNVVRGAAIGLLGLVRLPRAVQELADTLVGPSRDADPYPRCEAATALPLHDGEIARRALVGALNDESENVRQCAIAALSKLAGTRRGFDPGASADARCVAVERWEEWLQEWVAASKTKLN